MFVFYATYMVNKRIYYRDHFTKRQDYKCCQKAFPQLTLVSTHKTHHAHLTCDIAVEEYPSPASRKEIYLPILTGIEIFLSIMHEKQGDKGTEPVSYTHLTLPTILRV